MPHSSSSPPPPSSTLDQVPLRTTVTITQVGGDRGIRRRLLEMGLVPGTRVTPVNVAPLGDPIEIAVRHGRLSIRRFEAAQLAVKAAAHTSAHKVDA